ncbi:shugoshin 2-like isoform X1 [Poecile atricapillus]|uniref:shugoshin 2-like isoform X1 n=2 Tax=Poecile atricapillus TaxID=48891 RepID=UPI0027388764|nr:shugoshin 2-like isoform X1 [Poecile atricapillus]
MCRAMAEWESAEMSSFSLSGVRDRMREKKKGALRTAKLNASLASKIKTKIINNSSIMKVSLKQNNKALALALNAEKANAQRLTQEKTILQKEVKQCHFQNAVLRHRLSFLNNTLKKMDNLMAAVRMAELSEFHTNSASLSSGRKSSMTEDSWADDIADGQLLRIPMRVPISKLHDAEQQAGSSTAVQTSSGELQRPASNAGELQRLASNEPLKIVPIASKDTLLPQHDGKLQFHQEENSKKVTDTLATEEAFHDSHIFREVLCTTEQNPNNLPALAWESHPLSYEADEMAKHFFRLSQGHVTQRRKCSTSFATSTPSSALDMFPRVSSTQAAWGTTAQDNSSSSKNNTQQQLRSPSPLASPAQTAVISHRNSVGKETFCEQPQTKEMGCGVEMDPSYSQVPEFVPVKVKSKGNCKTGEKKTVKKARTGKEKTTAIKNNAESNTGRPQGEECAQNAKKLLQPKVATCSSEAEVCEKGQRTHEGAFDRKNRDCGVEHHSHSPAGVQDFGSTYEVNPAQLQSLESVDLMQKVKKVPMFEIQSMESLLKSPVCTFSSHDVPSDDSSLQNPTKFSSESRKSIRQKANRKTRVIRQREDSDEEYVPSHVIIPEAKAEDQPERSLRSRKNAVRKSNCDQRNEVNGFRPWIDVQEVANDSTKDLPGNLKQRRETYIVHPLDLAGNSGCFQTEFEGGENVPPRSVPGSKGSKIPRAAKSNQKSTIKQIGGLQEKGQGEVDNNMNALKKEASCKPKAQRKRSNSRPPDSDSLAGKSDGAKVLIGSSTELASKQTVLMGKFSCITHLLSEPDTFLEEQLPEISLADSLTDFSHSLEASHVSSSGVLPVSSRLTEVSVSKSLSTEGKRMSAKSPVCLKNSLIVKKKTAEEIPGERNQVQSSSWSTPSKEPDIRPLQDLKNACVLSPSGLEESSGRPSRRKRKPTCYKEPLINRKLRQGDPFTDTEFLHSPIYKRKRKPVKAKGMTKKMKENQEGTPEECLGAKAMKFITTERIVVERQPPNS